MGLTFSLGPQQPLEKQFLLNNYPLLVVYLLFILIEPFLSNFQLLILYLLCDHESHEQRLARVNELLQSLEQRFRIQKLLLKCIGWFLRYFHTNCPHIDRSCVHDVLNIAQEFRTFFLKFNYLVHYRNQELYLTSIQQQSLRVVFWQLCLALFLRASSFKLYCNNRSMEQGLKTRLPIYGLLGATTVLGTLLFMTWTADDGLANLVSLFYHQQQIKTFNQELKIILKTAYYFSVLSIIYYAAAELYERITKKDESGPAPYFSQITKEALIVSFHTFVIFQAFFYYLLNNDGDDLSKKYINLLPFWFLASWTVYMVGAWLAKWAQLNLYMSGIIMIAILWTMILGEIYQNGFINKVLNL